MAVLSIPYAFTNNTIANAIEVNSDFNAVKAFVESALVQVDGTVKAGTAALQDSAVTSAKLDYAVTVPRITVSPTEPLVMKAGDVWVQI